MNVKFVDRKGEPTGNAHSLQYVYAEKKVAKLDRFFRSDADATVTCTNLKKGMVKVEVAVSAGGNLYRGEATTSDANASLDSAVRAIERQIRKFKTRMEKRLHNDDLESLFAQDFDEEVEEDTISILRTKKFAFKPMSVEEAVLQMNMIGHTFFAFRNADNNDAVAVVYARSCGGYGLIEDDLG